MLNKLIERLKQSLSERKAPKRICRNCFYFAEDLRGFKCVHINHCIDYPKPVGFCPLFATKTQPTEEQIVKNYLERCLATSEAADNG